MPVLRVQRRPVLAGRSGAVLVLSAGIVADRRSRRSRLGRGFTRHLPLIGSDSAPARSASEGFSLALRAGMLCAMLFLLKRTWPPALLALLFLSTIGLSLRAL